MTLFVNLRAGPYGAVCSPYVLTGTPPDMQSLSWETAPILVRDKDVFLAAHGFNVSYASGLASLAELETALAIQPKECFLGVLWPGDWAIPAINYPFEDKIASNCGDLLAGFINRWLSSARTVSLASHSLGARVILAAIKGSQRRIRRACITAGAVNAGCLGEEFAAANANCDSIITLSSREDRVLEFAYPPGDLLADVLDPDRPPFEAAMGRDGPNRPYSGWVRPYEIADADGYDHSDYFPPSDPANPATKWKRPAAFMARVLRDQGPTWP
jgi:hypothetical protein